MRFKFAILISFSLFVVTVVIETGSRTFLVLELFEVSSEGKIRASILGITSNLMSTKDAQVQEFYFS